MLDYLGTLETITYGELAFRIFIAALFGCLIGIDRDVKNKPVDFRAYMIVCVSACVIAILGQELYSVYHNEDDFIRLDLGKIIAGSLTGIGFLGAGAIIKNSNNEIIGTATGAGIWGSSIIGLCIGFGQIILAFFSFVTIWLILILARNLFDKFQEK
jgi:putative Mg2+ transporter-C (MgtC) family protein